MFHFSKLSKLLVLKNFKSLHLLIDSKNVCIIGWVNNIIKLKHKTFLKIQDGRSHESIQIVLENNLLHNELSRGSCIKVTGEIVPSKGKGQSSELIAKCYDLLSEKQNNSTENIDVVDQLFSSKNTGLKPELARKDLLHVRHRLSYYSAIGRIRANTKNFIRDYMLNKEYLEVDSPCLTSIDCEGAGEVFKVITEGSTDNFEAPKLSVSAQLHLEALVLGYGKVYSLGPVFRANKSKTRFHLSEFLMLEAESVNINNVSELCNEIEELVKDTVSNFVRSNVCEMEEIRKSDLVESDEDQTEFLLKICEADFARVTFNESVEMLKKEGLIANHLENKSVDLNKLHEQHLVKMFGNLPVFITDFPSGQKPFYCKSSKDATAMATDLLLPSVGEVVGGTVRENDWVTLRTRINEAGLNEKEMAWYLDLRCNGGCPHAGFGLGFDRLLQFMTGISNIQDVVTFPRIYDTCKL